MSNFDAFSSANSHAGSTVATSLAVAAGANRVLVALIGNSGALTVNGVAYTAGSGGAWQRFNGAGALDIWFSVAPALGAVTVEATFSGSIAVADGEIALYSINDADQTTPLNGFANGTVSPISLTSPVGDIALAMATSGGPFTTFNPAQDATDVWNAYYVPAHQAGAGATGWTFTNGAGPTWVACNVITATGGGSPTLMGQACF